MSENLLVESDNSPTDIPADDTQPSICPPGLPEKFWDGEQNQVRTEAMTKSYLELEKKFGSQDIQGDANVPETPDDYEIESTNEIIAPDGEVNARLHELGLNNEQAQAVYDLAGERLMPMVAEIASQFEAQNQIDRLVSHFGGEDKWRETSRQIKNWGKSHFPGEVFDALSTTCEGIQSMHQMMTKGEPEMGRVGDAASEVTSEASIKAIMRDPRYWRDNDPGMVAKVQAGFKRLFPD